MAKRKFPSSSTAPTSSAPDAAHGALPRPTAIETWEYVNRLIIGLFAAGCVVSVAGFTYDLVTRSAAEEARGLVAGETPSPEAIRQAFDLVRTPHVLAGWHGPKSVFPADEPALAAVDEEALALAVSALPAAPPRGKTKVEDCGSLATLTPAVANCVASALGRAFDQSKGPQPDRYRMYRYLLLRRSMARSEALSADELRYFQWNLTLWVRAFDRQIVTAGQGTPTASDAAMVRHLAASKAGASDNGLVISWYALAIALLFGGTGLGWRRLRVRFDVADREPGGPVKL